MSKLRERLGLPILGEPMGKEQALREAREAAEERREAKERAAYWRARPIGMHAKAIVGAVLSPEHIAGDVDRVLEMRREREHARAERKRRRRKKGPEKQVWLVPHRQEELEPLRAFIKELVPPGGGPERHAHRMAWAEVLRSAGFRDVDSAWVIAGALGNAEDAEKLVENTRRRHESCLTNRGKGYLEAELGTKAMLRYAELLARIRVKGQPLRTKPKKRGATGPSGDLRRLVRASSGLPKQAREAMKGYAEFLRSQDPTDPAINALLRPSSCRLFHEQVTCKGCRGSRGKRRLACEDELCAWCHGTRVLHEHELVLKMWRDAGVKDVLGLEVYGFATLGEVAAWVRARNLPRLGLFALKVKSHRFVDATEEETAAARVEGRVGEDATLEGRIEHGVLLLVPWTGYGEACMFGARIQSKHASLTRYTLEGAAERAAQMRWQTHTALRTAAMGGQVIELARILRHQFRRQAASGGPKALAWPGREDARTSIIAEVAQRREAELKAKTEAAAAAGVSCCGEEHACECDPRQIGAEHALMSSGRSDAVVVHRQDYRHTIPQAIKHLKHHELEQRLEAEARAEEEARELAAVPF